MGDVVHVSDRYVPRFTSLMGAEKVDVANTMKAKALCVTKSLLWRAFKLSTKYVKIVMSYDAC